MMMHAPSLFQGAVTHAALQNAYQQKHPRPLLQHDNYTTSHPPKTILMRGPHGKGSSQVAIDHVDGRGVFSAIRSRVLGGEGSVSHAALKCRLVFVSLPWHCIIQDMLASA